MHIRDATRDDLEIIVAFNRALAVDSDDHVPDEDVLRRGVQRALERPELCRYFLAEDDATSTIIGQTMITYEWTDWRDGVIWWLQSVYVHREHRRRGVFRSLFSHIQSLAEADPEVRGLRLYALTSNQRAHAAYTTCGMKHSGYEVFELSLMDS